MSEKNDNFVSIADIVHLCVSRWYWFVVTIAVCLAVAVYKNAHISQSFTFKTTIFVSQDTDNKSSVKSIGSDVSSLGFVNQDVNARNVVNRINSLDILMPVARRLGLATGGDDLINAALGLRRSLSVELSDKQSSKIDITFTDHSKERARLVLEMILQVYEERWVQDRLIVTQHTSDFIDSRLKLLERDLDSVDENISTFKSENGITDLGTVSDIYLKQQNQSDLEIIRMSNQKSMAEYVCSLVEERNAPLSLLPTNMGIDNGAIEAQIVNYNGRFLEYSNHLNYTSSLNPRIVTLEEDLRIMRANIHTAIRNHIKALNIQLNSLTAYNDEAVSKVFSSPEQAKFLTTIEREQQVKEGLYLYLLQKKEENEISSTYNPSNVKILDVPYLSKSSSGKKLQTLGAAALLGLLLPVVLLFVMAITDKTVRKRADVEGTEGMPLLGIVPECGGGLIFSRARGLVVADGVQDGINESFRMLRTAVEQKLSGRIIMVTSSEDDSGKTFIAANLAIALAIHNKRVLFIDGDLREGGASRLFDAMGAGLADYLNGLEEDVSSLLIGHSVYTSLDILGVGFLPSNPTELLASRGFEEMMATLPYFDKLSTGTGYDYVVVDTPKLGRLADADIIAPYVDSTLFVMRIGKTARKDIRDLEACQKEGRYKQPKIILNGTKKWQA